MSPRNKSLANFALYGCFIVIAVLGYIESANFPKPLLPGYPGSALFPRFAMALMGIFSAVGIALELLRLMRGRASVAASAVQVDDDGAPVSDGASLYEFLIIVAVLAVVIAVTDWFGMEAGVFGFVTALTYFVTRRALISIVAGASTVLLVYVVFVQALSVGMPLTFLPRYPGW